MTPRPDLAARETIANTLMDCRASWSWNEPPSTLTYQESMRRLADAILRDLSDPRLLDMADAAPKAGEVTVERLARALEATTSSARDYPFDSWAREILAALSPDPQP